MRNASGVLGNGTAIELKVPVRAQPVARVAVRERVAAGEHVTFNAGQSSTVEGSSLVAFDWTANGVYAGSGADLDHVFDAPGDYQISLRVVDAANHPCNIGLAETHVRVNAPPVARAGGDRVAIPGEIMRFDAAASTDFDGAITRYAWDFGDGSAGEGAIITHGFAAPGTYAVTLRVEDDAGVANSAATDRLTVRVNAPPVADAGADRTVIINRAVQFSGAASRDPDGSIISYAWDFGGGVGKSGQNVVYAYPRTGTYPVILTVTDDSGLANSTNTATIMVRVVDAPNVPPQAKPGPDRRVAVGEQIEFDGSGSTDTDGSIVAYEWDFGDGNQATGVRRTHTYWTPGRYTAKLTVRDDFGLDNDRDSGTAEITVTQRTNVPPVAAAGGNRTVDIGSVVTFDGSASRDPDGAIIAYQWDFGDGASAAGAVSTNTYWTPGRYTARLTVQDNSGLDNDHATDTIEVTVRDVPNVPPVAGAGGNRTVEAGSVVTFDGSASRDPDGTIVAYEWDFGDGVTAAGTVHTHTYWMPGRYTARVTVQDNSGRDNDRSTDAAEITVVDVPNVPPVAVAGGNRTVEVGGVVTFDGSASRDPDGAIVAYEWDFGDGIRAAGAVHTHTYWMPGRYTARLTVQDNSARDNNRGTDTAEIAVVDVPNVPPVAVAGGNRTVEVGSVVTFDGSASHDPDGAIVAYEWDFGDGIKAAGAVHTHTYWMPGRYTAKLTVQDNSARDNNRSTDTAEITVVDVPNVPPVANAGPDKSAVVGEIITFDASASRDPDGNIVAYRWDFGNGATATGKIARYAYQQPGMYAVTLTVTDDSGRSNAVSSTTVEVTIDPRPNAPPRSRADVPAAGAIQ